MQPDWGQTERSQLWKDARTFIIQLDTCPALTKERTSIPARRRCSLDWTGGNKGNRWFIVRAQCSKTNGGLVWTLTAGNPQMWERINGRPSLFTFTLLFYPVGISLSRFHSSASSLSLLTSCFPQKSSNSVFFIRGGVSRELRVGLTINPSFGCLWNAVSSHLTSDASTQSDDTI